MTSPSSPSSHPQHHLRSWRSLARVVLLFLAATLVVVPWIVLLGSSEYHSLIHSNDGGGSLLPQHLQPDSAAAAGLRVNRNKHLEEMNVDSFAHLSVKDLHRLRFATVTALGTLYSRQLDPPGTDTVHDDGTEKKSSNNNEIERFFTIGSGALSAAAMINPGLSSLLPSVTAMFSANWARLSPAAAPASEQEEYKCFFRMIGSLGICPLSSCRRSRDSVLGTKMTPLEFANCTERCIQRHFAEFIAQQSRRMSSSSSVGSVDAAMRHRARDPSSVCDFLELMKDLPSSTNGHQNNKAALLLSNTSSGSGGSLKDLPTSISKRRSSRSTFVQWRKKMTNIATSSTTPRRGGGGGSTVVHNSTTAVVAAASTSSWISSPCSCLRYLDLAIPASLFDIHVRSHDESEEHGQWKPLDRTGLHAKGSILDNALGVEEHGGDVATFFAMAERSPLTNLGQWRDGLSHFFPPLPAGSHHARRGGGLLDLEYDDDDDACSSPASGGSSHIVKLCNHHRPRDGIVRQKGMNVKSKVHHDHNRKSLPLRIDLDIEQDDETLYELIAQLSSSVSDEPPRSGITHTNNNKNSSDSNQRSSAASSTSTAVFPRMNVTMYWISSGVPTAPTSLDVRVPLSLAADGAVPFFSNYKRSLLPLLKRCSGDCVPSLPWDILQKTHQLGGEPRTPTKMSRRPRRGSSIQQHEVVESAHDAQKGHLKALGSFRQQLVSNAKRYMITRSLASQVLKELGCPDCEAVAMLAVGSGMEEERYKEDVNRPRTHGEDDEGFVYRSAIAHGLVDIGRRVVLPYSDLLTFNSSSSSTMREPAASPVRTLYGSVFDKKEEQEHRRQQQRVAYHKTVLTSNPDGYCSVRGYRDGILKDITEALAEEGNGGEEGEGALRSGGPDIEQRRQPKAENEVKRIRPPKIAFLLFVDDIESIGSVASCVERLLLESSGESSNVGSSGGGSVFYKNNRFAVAHVLGVVFTGLVPIDVGPFPTQCDLLMSRGISCDQVQLFRTSWVHSGLSSMTWSLVAKVTVESKLLEDHQTVAAEKVVAAAATPAGRVKGFPLNVGMLSQVVVPRSASRSSPDAQHPIPTAPAAAKEEPHAPQTGGGLSKSFLPLLSTALREVATTLTARALTETRLVDGLRNTEEWKPSVSASCAVEAEHTQYIDPTICDRRRQLRRRAAASPSLQQTTLHEQQQHPSSIISSSWTFHVGNLHGVAAGNLDRFASPRVMREVYKALQRQVRVRSETDVPVVVAPVAVPPAATASVAAGSVSPDPDPAAAAAAGGGVAASRVVPTISVDVREKQATELTSVSPTAVVVAPSSPPSLPPAKDDAAGETASELPLPDVVFSVKRPTAVSTESLELIHDSTGCRVYIAPLSISQVPLMRVTLRGCPSPRAVKSAKTLFRNALQYT